EDGDGSAESRSPGEVSEDSREREDGMNLGEALSRRIDPIALAKLLWPKVHFYDKQREIIYSTIDNYQTVVPAGNMLGKDFTAGFLALSYFLTSGFTGRGECRVVTTSVKDKHLDVLWGEIGRFIQTSRYPLTSDKGGPLIVKHRETGIRRIINGKEDKYGYLIGMVAEKPESLSGHHADHALGIVDEASGAEPAVFDHMAEWAKGLLIIGNPHPCENLFRKATKRGDVRSEDGKGYYSKVIKIKAEDSPNVRLALAEIRAGLKPSFRKVLPGILTYGDYLIRRREWDTVTQCIKLDAEFYEGAEVLLYPPAWLDRAERMARSLKGRTRVAKALGIDPAQGGDSTAFAVIDEYGLIFLLSMKTPDTSVVPTKTLELMRRFNLQAEQVCFDRGGGKEHADRLRRGGYNVRTVAFGESIMMDPKRGMRQMEERVENREDRYAYFNRRAEMYGALRLA